MARFRAATSGDDRIHPLIELSRCDQRGRGAGARSEKTKAKAAGVFYVVEPLNGHDEPFGKQWNVEDIGAVLFLVPPKQIKQERRHPPGVERVRNLGIAWA